MGRPENIEKVLQDEERAEIIEERREILEEGQLRRKRLDLLRANNAKLDVVNPQMDHVTLFKNEIDLNKYLNGHTQKSGTEIEKDQRERDHRNGCLRMKSALDSHGEIRKIDNLKKSLEDPARLFMKPSYFNQKN